MSELGTSASGVQTEPVVRRDGFMPRSRRALSGVVLAFAALTACGRGEVAGLSSADSSPLPTASSSETPPTTTTTSALGTTATSTQFNREPLVPGSKHVEVRKYSFPDKADTFANYHTLAGAGPKIPGYVAGGDLAASSVNVDCELYDQSQADNTTHGYFYHLTGWKDGKYHLGGDVAGFYSPANTFWNQANPGAFDLNQPFDPNVPLCPGSPALPPR